MKYPKVSLLVLNYNGGQFIKKCLGSLLKQTYPNFEVIVIDNNSTDDSVIFVKKNFPNIKIIIFDKNLGFAGGYNKAISKIKTEYIALINNDAVADKKWLSESMKIIMTDKKIVASTSKILFYDKPQIINSAGTKITPIGAGFDIGFGESSKKYNYNQYNCSASGCAMIIKREAFNKIGGFDSAYFAYFEDVDLSWRLWLYGYKIVYVSTAIVYHKFGASFGGLESPNRVYYGERNRICNILKNFESKNLVSAIVFSTLFDLFKILKFLRNRKVMFLYLTLKADLDIFLSMKNIFKKRRIIQSRRSVSDAELLQDQIIVTIKQSIAEYLRVQRD